MNPDRAEGWIREPLVALAALAFSLALTSCGPPSPPEPKEPIPKVSILVLDRFDEPLAGVRVDVLRDHARSSWGDFQPWDGVADAVTDAEGRVEFTTLAIGTVATSARRTSASSSPATRTPSSGSRSSTRSAADGEAFILRDGSKREKLGIE